MSHAQPSPAPAPGKGRQVQRLFGGIARRYDFANHLMSGGLDFLWRRRAAKIVSEWAPEKILDLATGSGDLALALQKKLPASHLVGADFCLPMLQEARKKGVENLVQADALSLPFNDSSFDVVSIAFGLRNMENLQKALGEMSRVLRPNGHVLILDFSVPKPPLRGLYRFYLHRVLPKMAGFITGEKSAYEYLGASIEEFPQGNAMCTLIETCGFQNAKCLPLTGGIVSLYTADRAG